MPSFPGILYDRFEMLIPFRVRNPTARSHAVEKLQKEAKKTVSFVGSFFLHSLGSKQGVVGCLIEETESHVLVGLFLLLLLGLLGGGVGVGSAAGGSTTGSGGSTATGADVDKEILDVLALESLL